LKNIDPFEATLAQLSDFFLHLFHEMKRSMSTLKGYRTAIIGALEITGRQDLASGKVLSRLFRSLQRERPLVRNPVPQWDLGFILWSLTQAPFEPLRLADEKFVTWKTLFLVLLASGARRAEVHALDWKRVEHTRNWTSVTLHPRADFVHKTQLSNHHAGKPKVIHIPGLGQVLSPDMEESSLCPTRAIKIYLWKTEEFRSDDRRTKDQKTLFLSYDHKRHKHKSVGKNTLSGWVRKLIRYCYDNVNQKAAQLVGVRAHDLRGMAASLAFEGSAEMEDILRAGSWASPNTFISHYMKDAVMTTEGRQRLGHIVAAQQVVQLAQSS